MRLSWQLAGFALFTLLACREQPRKANSGASSAASSRATSSAGACLLRALDVRLGVDTIGGLPTRATIGELRALCPTARLDSVGVGGTSAASLRWDTPGATVWAIQTQHDAYDDSLRTAERADLWAARGDSVRFPDGAPVPQRIGSLRSLDSLAVVIVDHGDDGTGSYVVRCRYPELAIVVDNVWPPFARAGTVSLGRATASDTTRIWRIEVQPGRRDARVEQACKRAPAT